MSYVLSSVSTYVRLLIKGIQIKTRYIYITLKMKWKIPVWLTPTYVSLGGSRIPRTKGTQNSTIDLRVERSRRLNRSEAARHDAFVSTLVGECGLLKGRSGVMNYATNSGTLGMKTLSEAPTGAKRRVRDNICRSRRRFLKILH